MPKMDFGADDASAWGLMGYVAGITAKVKTTAYLNSVLQYTHARLSNFFDEYFDAIAAADPVNYQHMYEWPDSWHAYGETVGHPGSRLWQHVLSGSGKSAQATFRFLPSRKPSPVDPILLEEGPGGSVKEGVHIFVWKAEAFEYGMPITVKPTLAKMLAYVGRDENQGGSDAGWHHANEHEGGNMVNLSKGPVHFTAGGGKTTLRFTTQFILFWQNMAGDKFDSAIAPELEKDLVNQSKIDASIKRGQSRGKTMNITAQPAKDKSTFDAALAAAQADLDARQTSYIRKAAAARRLDLYGE